MTPETITKSVTATATRLRTGLGERLVSRLWQPTDVPIAGCIVVIHGLGEYGGRYGHVAQALAGHGWASLITDLPGHGESPGRRGHIASYVGLLRDVEAMRATARQLLPSVPQVLLGHSMGGNVAVNYVLRRGEVRAVDDDLIGLVLSGPMFLPAIPPTRSQIMAAWLTGMVMPWLTVRAPVDRSKLTRNPETEKRVREDPLIHNRISTYLATQLLAQGRYALDQAAEIDLPTLVLHGEDDPITSYHASESFALRGGENVQFVSFPEMLHEIFNEIHAEVVFSTLGDWLNRLSQTVSCAGQASREST